MFSKRFHRSHTRKYVGIVLTIDKLNYYVPFSSPKPSDYTKNGEIRKDNLFVARMIESDGSGGKVLLGTLRFNNMIPVPLLFVNGYSFEKEEDEKYVAIVSSEWKWINKNQSYIQSKAQKIYDFKNNENKLRNDKNRKRYELVLPYKEIENYIKEKYN